MQSTVIFSGEKDPRPFLILSCRAASSAMRRHRGAQEFLSPPAFLALSSSVVRGTNLSPLCLSGLKSFVVSCAPDVGESFCARSLFSRGACRMNWKWLWHFMIVGARVPSMMNGEGGQSDLVRRPTWLVEILAYVDTRLSQLQFARGDAKLFGSLVCETFIF